MKVLTFIPERCDGQRGCEERCAQTWFKRGERAYSSIRIHDEAAGFSATFCIQCGECIKVCPVDALYQDKQGVVRVRKHRCVGCLSCVGFCPYHVMFYDPAQSLPFKCVACGQCVEVCPTKALALAEVETPSTDLWHWQPA